MDLQALFEIVLTSLRVTLSALAIAALIGLPLGSWLGVSRFRGRPAAVALLYTGMGLPPVVVGLAFYLLLSRSGPLGFLGWLFNPAAMIAAQALIALPLVAGITMASVMAVPRELLQQARSLGASRAQATRTLLGEARNGLIVSLVAGFGSIISEVGAVLMVGGNIAGHTRVLTTAIVLETGKGNFTMALGLGAVLLGLALAVNATLISLQGRWSA